MTKIQSLAIDWLANDHSYVFIITVLVSGRTQGSVLLDRRAPLSAQLNRAADSGLGSLLGQGFRHHG